MNAVLKLEGLVCSQWIETKKVTGSFWIGSYDTEHFRTTKEVSAKECWDMKIQLACAGNRNVINGKTYSYTHKPVGGGKWMSITEYSVVNCLIELRQEESDGPILSPFGTHNVSITSEKIIVNHNTIVWHKPSDIGKNTHNCEQKGQFQSTGRLSLITVENDRSRINENQTRVGRLLDLEKQIEILFNPVKTNICTTSQIAYKITGIPDTYLVFEEEVGKYFSPKIKPRMKRQTQSQENDHAFSHVWGHIIPLSFFPPSEFDEKFDNKQYVVTTSAVENPLFLMPRVPPFNV
jgi:hypothetical protein